MAAHVGRIDGVLTVLVGEAQQECRVAVELVGAGAAVQTGRTAAEDEASHAGAVSSFGLNLVEGQLGEIQSPANIVLAFDLAGVGDVVGGGIAAVVRKNRAGGADLIEAVHGKSGEAPLVVFLAIGAGNPECQSGLLVEAGRFNVG